MKFNIRGENVEVTEALRDYVVKKVEKIEKYFNGEVSAEVQVRLKIYENVHKVEITIPMTSLLLRAEESHQDMYAAIDLIVDKLERQVRKYKTKVNRKARQQQRQERAVGRSVPPVIEEEQTDDFEIVRKKRFNLKPMDIEEAILQMNLLGHQFFVYFDVDTNGTNVVYKRNDGKYGVIETT